MTEKYRIECQIDIDAGHRIPHHASKCRNLHGHRYRIIAVCSGPLFVAGEQQGMVLDFGFLKEEMMQEIQSCCDHAMILWVDDPLAKTFIGDDMRFERDIRPQVVAAGCYATTQAASGALYLMDAVPTAENLAAHWFRRLQPKVQARSAGKATLIQVKVFETPNCMAAYPA